MATPPPGRLYPFELAATQLSCPACDQLWEPSLPVVVDWRDRVGLGLLGQTFPTVACVGCGHLVVTGLPVVLLRPGDPVPVLVSVAGLGPRTPDLMAELLTRYGDSGVVGLPGYIPFIEPQNLHLAADRYTGFALLDVDDPLGELGDVDELVPWLEAMRGSVGAAARGPLEEFLNAEDQDAARRMFIESPVLSGGGWLPALRRKAPELEAQQESADGRAGVHGRIALLSHLVIAGPDYVPNQPAARLYVELLRELTALNSSSVRTTDLVEKSVRLGRELMALSAAAWGPSDAMTLTAVNDAAAAMMDDPAHVSEATSLLDHAQRMAAEAHRPVLADITTNLGIAHLRHDRVPNADDLDRAVGFLKDAVHLYRVLEPDRPTKATTALINLAALVRSSLTRTEDVNVEESFSLLADIDALLQDGRNELGIQDEVTRCANELNTLANHARLKPSPESRARMIAMIDALDPKVAELHGGHPVRLRALNNLGSIVCDNLGQLPGHRAADLTRRAEEWLNEAVRESVGLPADDALRVLPRMTLAALRFQRGSPSDLADAQRLLNECVAGLEGTASTRLHQSVFYNLAQLHLARGENDEAIEALTVAGAHADKLIRAAATPATRLAQVASAGDVFQRLAFLHTMKKDARSAIHTIERSRARWRGADPNGDVASDELDRVVRDALAPGTGLLYAGTCSLGTYAVILTGSSGAGAFVLTPNSHDLQPIVAQLAASSSTGDVDAAFEVAGQVLGESFIRQVVGIVKLAALDRLLVVAGGPLSALPLAAIGSSEGCLTDHVEVRHLIGVRGQGEPRQDSMSRLALGVANPTGDLPFASSELAALARYLPTLVPPPGAGLKKWLVEHAAESALLHLACHAEVNLEDPFNSRFILGQNLHLTVGDLEAVDLGSMDLVVATACKSGVVDARTSDEQIGLAPALIAAGAGAVIASLWDLRDLATAVVVAKFYDELTRDRDPAAALRAAQRWVATATTTDLRVALMSGGWLPESLHRELRGRLLHPENRAPRAVPFESPAHWAGLMYVV